MSARAGLTTLPRTSGAAPARTPPHAAGRGDAVRGRTAVALAAAGFATFAPLYSPQPLLPLLGNSFGVSPAQASLVISVATAALAVVTVGAGFLTDLLGRRRVMVSSMAAAGALGLLCAASPGFAALLAIRALQGLAVAGVPVSAIALIHDDIEPRQVGFANGLYIGGTALGGMLGRLIAAVLSDLVGWRAALLVVAGLSLLATLVFVVALPPSPQPRRPRPRLRSLLTSLRGHATEPGLLILYALGGLSIAAFVGFSNALPYRLVAAPYGLSASLVGFAFTVYAVGIVASPLAGRLVDRLGRRRVLPGAIVVSGAGFLLASAAPLPLVIIGFLLVASGFFAGNSVITGWVARRAGVAVAQATSLYYCAFYAGSSLSGPAAGAAWSWGGWEAVSLGCLAFTVASLALVVILGRLPNRVVSQRSGDASLLVNPV